MFDGGYHPKSASLKTEIVLFLHIDIKNDSKCRVIQIIQNTNKKGVLIMKIGILTYFGDLNTGTNLQAYATLKCVKNLHPEAEVFIINYHSWYERKIPYLRQGINFKTLTNDIRRIYEFNKFVKEKLAVKSKGLLTSNCKKAINYIKKHELDIIYVGADTVLELHRIQNGLTAYWLSPEIKSKKIFIAASARSTMYEKLTESQKKLMNESLLDFRAFGVRDQATLDLFSRFINKKKITIVPDPTFTLEIDYSPIEKYLSKKSYNFDKPTICFHLLRGDNWGKELAMKLKADGFQIATFRPNTYSDITLNDLSPLEQLGIYRYFKLMITHRFHDTIFCLKNHTPVITYPYNDSLTTENGDSKYFSLLKSFDLDKTNYIHNKSTITADNVYKMYKNAITSFSDKLDNTKIKLAVMKTEYLEYLRSTKL